MPEVFNACTYLLDRQLAQGHGDRVAVTGPRGTYTYRQLHELTCRVAAGLRELGVRPEERVMLCTVDSPNMMATILAAMRIGAVPVPISTMVKPADIALMVRDSRASVLMLSAEFADAAATAIADAPDLRTVVFDGRSPTTDPGLGWDFAGLLDAGAAAPASAGEPYETWDDTVGLWLYTSGTTGRPKGAVHRHAAIRAVCETYASRVLGIGPDDRVLCVPKMFFAYGLGNSCFFALSAGATTVLEPARPTPDTVTARLREDRPTIFVSTPSFFAAMLAAPVPVDAMSSVRLATSAGEPLPAPLYQRFVERYGVDIIDGIGSTEALHIFISNHPGRVRPGTSGTPVPGYDVRIVDDDGRDVPAGTQGHLLVRGESVALGYWCRTETTRRVFQGEWLRTGDFYVASPDGYYTYLGRSDDMIKAGGIWVSPTEVESRLMEHPAVGQAAVIAVPDADGLDKPVACVVRSKGTDVDGVELMGFCRDGLASYKCPRTVLFFDELPVTATGKVRRFVLRDEARTVLAGPAAAAGAEPAAAGV